MGGPWVAELEALNEVVLLAALAHAGVRGYLAEVRCWRRSGATRLRGVCHVSSRVRGVSHVSSRLRGVCHVSSRLRGVSHVSSRLRGSRCAACACHVRFAAQEQRSLGTLLSDDFCSKVNMLGARNIQAILCRCPCFTVLHACARTHMHAHAHTNTHYLRTHTHARACAHARTHHFRLRLARSTSRSARHGRSSTTERRTAPVPAPSFGMLAAPQLASVSASLACSGRSQTECARSAIPFGLQPLQRLRTARA